MHFLNNLNLTSTTTNMETKRDPVSDDILVRSGLAEFTRNIKLGKFERSYDVAKRTVVILNKMVKENSWPTVRHLMGTLKDVCTYIDGLGLVETAAGNMVRRVMRIIRDECQNFSLAEQRANQTDETTSFDRDEMNDTYLDLIMSSNEELKENILEGIEQELMNELELSSKSIAQQATDYVQSDEIILTLGRSKIIESFLRHAASGSKTGTRKFKAVVVELAPFYSGLEMAKSLNRSGIETLIIPDSAVFAIMSRVNKVIIGTHSMMANGGIKAPAGSHSIALAAKHFSVPLIVCCPMYKLTPEYLVSHDAEAFKQFSNLHAAFPEPYASSNSNHRHQSGQQQSKKVNEYQDDDNFDVQPTTFQGTGDSAGVGGLSSPGPISSTAGRPGRCVSSGSVEALHSTFDYVPPELITLFVSNIGGKSPSYVYQLLNELYYKSDFLV